MFEIGGAEIYSEIQVGSQDLSHFIEKKFVMKDGKAIELHDLTGYKGKGSSTERPSPASFRASTRGCSV
jgi:hypothetical protein